MHHKLISLVFLSWVKDLAQLVLDVINRQLLLLSLETTYLGHIGKHSGQHLRQHLFVAWWLAVLFIYKVLDELLILGQQLQTCLDVAIL